MRLLISAVDLQFLAVICAVLVSTGLEPGVGVVLKFFSRFSGFRGGGRKTVETVLPGAFAEHPAEAGCQ
jgi:hypothetical protein